MKTSNNTILITGGATGIGLAMTTEFIEKGNEVIICGRRENVLNEVKNKYPKAHIFIVDLSKSEERKSFVGQIIKEFPKLNILINNAGIQREFLVNDADVAEKFETENEIEGNLTAPIHLTMLLLPHLKQNQNAAIINITSGLGYVAHARMPVYCATKSALQSFTKSLRHQLRHDNVKVFDVAPPIVDTDLDKGARKRRGDTNKGIKPEVFVDKMLKGMLKDKFEIEVGQSKATKIGSRVAPKTIFKAINGK